MSEENITKTYYEKQLDILNKLPDLKSKKIFSKNMDFSFPIEKDEDATIIQEIRSFSEFPYKDTSCVIGQKINSYLNKEDLAKQIWEIQPYFYDRAKLWWLWDNNEKRWKIVDEKDLLILVSESSNANTVISKDKIEILEAMSQYGRKKIPRQTEKTWVQFKDQIYDVSTRESFEATPEYFVTNPIPWKISENYDPNTPIMDKVFKEWVGENNVQTLYEILAYSILPDYPIQRLFCLMGSGLNGKSCFQNLQKKFVGDYNCCTTDLDILLLSRFEATRLYKKLVCFMGETNFNEMSKTSVLKRLTGGDLIGFEFKNKDLLQDVNYAKIMIGTNNLPTTTDKTIGFYRRWMIVDFPNKFSEKKDILSEIPEEEYTNLATKSLIILGELLNKREFTNEGSIEERMEKYEAKSNFLDKFIKLFIDEDLNGFITKGDFIKKFSAWCKENNHREMSETSIGSEMKKKGYESGVKHFDWMNDGKGGNARVWLGFKWKE